MAVRIVRLGTPRAAAEGVRIGTVRRPPRGVPRSEFASRDYYDVWLPNLAPSAGLMTAGRNAVTEAEWSHFAKAYRREMNAPDASRVIDLLAALSHASAFAVGCYCEDERHCHRGILRDLLSERGAMISSN
ncbi:MAG TPA: DUF488 family protein [Telluria sp.]